MSLEGIKATSSSPSVYPSKKSIIMKPDSLRRNIVQEPRLISGPGTQAEKSVMLNDPPTFLRTSWAMKPRLQWIVNG